MADGFQTRHRVRALPRAIGAWVAVAAFLFAAQVTAQVTPSQLDRITRELAEGDAARGAEFEREGRLLEAEQMFERSARADRGYLPGALGLARVRAAQGRRDEALRALADVAARALQTDDDLLALANAHADVGDFDGALAVIDRRTDHPSLVRARADIAAKAGRFVLALAEARRLFVLVRGRVEEPAAHALVEALEILAGTLDPVRRPGHAAASSPVRRALMRAP